MNHDDANANAQRTSETITKLKLRKDLAGMVQANAEQFELRTQDHEEILSLRVALAEREAEAASAWDKCEERRIENEALKIAHRSHEDSNLKMLAKLKQQAFAEKELRAALVECREALCLPCDRWNKTQYEIVQKALTRCKEVLRK
jgi:hypothetical protein